MNMNSFMPFTKTAPKNSEWHSTVPMAEHSPYTCIKYREEMILLSLQRQMHQKNLPEAEKEKLLEEIRKIERLMQISD
jgi:hypothetical protein